LNRSGVNRLRRRDVAKGLLLGHLGNAIVLIRHGIPRAPEIALGLVPQVGQVRPHLAREVREPHHALLDVGRGQLGGECQVFRVESSGEVARLGPHLGCDGFALGLDGVELGGGGGRGRL